MKSSCTHKGNLRPFSVRTLLARLICCTSTFAIGSGKLPSPNSSTNLICRNVLVAFRGCHETPHQPHRLRTGSTPAPEMGIFEYWNKTVFVALLVGVNKLNRWHTDSQQCTEPRPQTAPAKATGGRQDYHDFEAPLLTMLLVLDWTRRFDSFLYRRDLYLGPVRTVRPVRCFVTPGFPNLNF